MAVAAVDGVFYMLSAVHKVGIDELLWHVKMGVGIVLSVAEVDPKTRFPRFLLFSYHLPPTFFYHLTLLLLPVEVCFLSLPPTILFTQLTGNWTAISGLRSSEMIAKNHPKANSWPGISRGQAG